MRGRCGMRRMLLGPHLRGPHLGSLETCPPRCKVTTGRFERFRPPEALAGPGDRQERLGGSNRSWGQ
eukprot:9478335-Pyramimonas_sp.AAC.1